MSESTVESTDVSKKLDSLKDELSIAAKQKLECFQDLRKALGQTPRVQEQLDEAHERYFQACRANVEEIEAKMSRVRRGVSA